MSARVGVVGFAHEVNAFADPVGRAHGVDASCHPGGLRSSWEAGPLATRLAGADVELVELPCWEFGASGPLLHDDFRAVLDEVAGALRSAGTLDAIVVLGHGAGRTTADLDPDATFFEMLRDAVGDGVPIVVLLDFHANLSDRMCRAVDVVVGYRTNPHVDIAERLVEVAEHVLRLLGGSRPRLAWCRLPLVLPQIAQLTTDGEPMGELRRLVETRSVGPVWSASVFGGFSLGDSPDAGVSCVAVADDDGAAERVVHELASLAWALRPRYRMHATPLPDAVAIAADAARGVRPPVILADASDNPGGGAPANSTFVLAALAVAGVDDVVVGLQCDSEVVAAAQRAGEGAHLRVTFNAGSTRPLAREFSVDATVLRLVDAPLVPTKGVYLGSTRRPGPSCALLLHTGGPRGIRIGVSTHPVQCADDDTLRHVGLAPESASVVVVKSRGHFRAGFEHLFSPDQVVEVGAPGVASCELGELPWEHLRRPVAPLDVVTDFVPVIERGGVRT